VASVSRFISAPPEAVFDVLENGWLYPAWVVGASRVRSVDTAWPAREAVIHHSVGVWPLVLDDTTTMRAWAPPNHAALRARGWPIGEADVTFDVRAHEKGSIVRMGEDAAQGPGTLIPRPLRTLLITVRNRETLRRLAWLAEQRTQPPQDPTPETLTVYTPHPKGP
jgi:hypothetical protein